MSPVTVFFVLVYGGMLALTFVAIAAKLPWGWALLIAIACGLIPPAMMEAIEWLCRADERWRSGR